MKISKGKSNNYNDVNTDSLVRYIKEYSYIIYTKLDNISDDTLAKKNRTELKQIAADLETAEKRLDYLIDGEY